MTKSEKGRHHAFKLHHRTGANWPDKRDMLSSETIGTGIGPPRANGDFLRSAIFPISTMVCGYATVAPIHASRGLVDSVVLRPVPLCSPRRLSKSFSPSRYRYVEQRYAFLQHAAAVFDDASPVPHDSRLLRMPAVTKPQGRRQLLRLSPEPYPHLSTEHTTKSSPGE